MLDFVSIWCIFSPRLFGVYFLPTYGPPELRKRLPDSREESQREVHKSPSTSVSGAKIVGLPLEGMRVGSCAKYVRGINRALSRPKFPQQSSRTFRGKWPPTKDLVCPRIQAKACLAIRRTRRGFVGSAVVVFRPHRRRRRSSSIVARCPKRRCEGDTDSGRGNEGGIRLLVGQ